MVCSALKHELVIASCAFSPYIIRESSSPTDEDGMSKSLCKWRRGEVEANLELLREMVKKPKFACKKCARVANTKKALCSAVKLKK